MAKIVSQIYWYLVRGRGPQHAARVTFRTNVLAFRKSFFRLFTGRRIIGCGGTCGLALSLFGHSKKDENLSLSSSAKQMSLRDIIYKSDAFYDAYLIDDAFAVLEKYANSRDPEILWRFARVLCEKGKMSEGEEERKEYIHRAMEMINKALDNEGNEGCFGAHKWYAILLNYVGKYQGTKERIKKSYEIKDHLEKALDLNCDDPTTWHLLGVWHFTFADMGTCTRLVAKAIFETPPNSTYEEALKCFEKAEFISPNFYSMNTWYMAESYDRMGRKATALEHYVKAFKMPIITADDKEVHDLAREKLIKAGLDCNKFL